MVVMTFFDFNFWTAIPGFAPGWPCATLAHELWPHNFFSIDGWSAQVRVRCVRAALPWQFPGTVAGFVRAVPRDGFCPTDLSGKSARYRDLPECRRHQTLPQWHSSGSRSEHPSRRQRKTRLAHLADFAHLLVALLKKRLKLSLSLHAMLQILSLTLFEKTPLLQLFSDPDMLKDTIDSHDQPSLPGFLTG